MKPWHRVRCILVLLICVSGCTLSARGTAAPSPTWTPLATLQSQPRWVLWTNPAASSSESIGSFRENDRNICAEIALGSLVQKGDRFGEPDTVSGRVDIYIDGTLLTNQPQVGWAKSLTERLDNNGNAVASWSGPYTFCWSAKLGTGMHLAELRFQLTSGGVRKYRWQFALTKESPP